MVKIDTRAVYDREVARQGNGEFGPQHHARPMPQPCLSVDAARTLAHDEETSDEMFAFLATHEDPEVLVGVACHAREEATLLTLVDTHDSDVMVGLGENPASTGEVLSRAIRNTGTVEEAFAMVTNLNMLGEDLRWASEQYPGDTDILGVLVSHPNTDPAFAAQTVRRYDDVGREILTRAVSEHPYADPGLLEELSHDTDVLTRIGAVEHPDLSLERLREIAETDPDPAVRRRGQIWVAARTLPVGSPERVEIMKATEADRGALASGGSWEEYVGSHLLVIDRSEGKATL